MSVSDYSERAIGIYSYLTPNVPGIGGKLKGEVEHFYVEESSIVPPEHEDGQYTIARIRVRNWETNRLVRFIASNLHISRRAVMFAGTKDKRAVTTQLFCIKAPPEAVLSLNIPDVEVLSAYPSRKKIEIGNLIGNRFRIFLADPDIEGSELEERLGTITQRITATGGFPAFFGVQRFGAQRPVTHIVGKHIVKGDFRGAVHAYAGNPSDREGKEVREARAFVDETGDYAEALKTYPRHLTFEREMLEHLAAVPGDYAGALKRLPKNLLMMFVHAYQAYMFNLAVSERMQRGISLTEPDVGEIVIPIDRNGLPYHERPMTVTEGNRELMARRIKEGRAFISSVLFGSESEFSGGRMGEIEREIVEREGLKREDFIIPQIREISSRGHRREILAPVSGLKWNLKEGGVWFEFQLTKGNYATVLLREYMKSGDIMDY